MLEEREAEIEERTRSSNPTEVSLCEEALSLLADGFEALGTETDVGDDRRDTTLLLITFAYNSARWAIELMWKGYYSQSIALSRSAWEAWLNAAYLQLCTERTVEEWRSYNERPRPVAMRELVAERSAEMVDGVDKAVFQAGMNQLFSEYSAYSHPTDQSLKVLVGQRDGSSWLRLGGDYDEPLLRLSVNAFCLATLEVASLFNYVLADPQHYLSARNGVAEAWRAWGGNLI